MAVPHLFCFGLGYSALGLCESLRFSGTMLAGTTRHMEKAEICLRRGIAATPYDGYSPLPKGTLTGSTHILVSIPPDSAADTDADPVLRHHRDDILALMDGKPPIAWLGYLSTTGVYGDRDGDWVDETSDLHPTSDRARRRVEAENAWLRLWQDFGLPVHIFRLAGIYGPGRSVLDQLRAGRASRIIKQGHRFSRIHLADIAKVLAASMAKPRPGAIYNVCDDEPAAQADVVEFGAGLLGMDPPPEVSFEDADLSHMAQSFWADNKRVKNAVLKSDLGVTLDYPDYRAGLRAVAAMES